MSSPRHPRVRGSFEGPRRPDPGSAPPSGGSPVEGAEEPGQSHAGLRDAVRESWDRERWLHLALEAGQMGAWEFDPDSGAVRWSPTLEAIHGIPEGSFAGTFEAFLKDVHPEDMPRLRRSIERASSGEPSHYHLQYRIIRPDGETRWLEAHGRFEADPDGKGRRLVGVCTDISDRQALRAERDAATRRNRKLLSITGAIAEAVSPAEVQEAVVDQVSAALGASS
ncbi:MAG: PAS domain S-box protein, partial [Gemmatimonadales bacterium]